MIEQDLLGEIEKHQAESKASEPGERAEALGLFVDRVLDRAGYLVDWRGRANDYFACLDDAGAALEELLALRRSEADLLRLARHRFEVATHVRDSAAADPDDEGAHVHPSGAATSSRSNRDTAFLEGFRALNEVAGPQRPVTLEARQLKRHADLQAGAANISGAIEDLERAVALWPTANRDGLTAADFSEITDVHLGLARLLRIADRPEDAVDRLAAGLASVRPLRQGRAGASGSEASAHVWLAAVEQELGRKDAERRSLENAVDAHRELSRGVARDAGAWLPCVAEILRRLARLEDSVGSEDAALRRLAEALQAGNDPDAMFTFLEIARIETHRHQEFVNGTITEIRDLLEASLNRLACSSDAESRRHQTTAFAAEACKSVPPESRHPERSVRLFWLATATTRDWPFDEESFTEVLRLFPNPGSREHHLWFFRPAWEAEAVDSDWERFRFLYAGLSPDHRESADAVLGGFPDFRRGLAGLAKPS
jgi:tetratricopeptide (TPR) repeat protein